MPPRGPPPASASPILLPAFGADVRRRVRMRVARPEAFWSGMVLLIGVAGVLAARSTPNDRGELLRRARLGARCTLGRLHRLRLARLRRAHVLRRTLGSRSGFL